jgi:hypothetical protein
VISSIIDVDLFTSDKMLLPAFAAKAKMWGIYILSAQNHGLFEGNDGSDLKSRLTRKSDEGFYGALGECLACWYFADKLRFGINPKPIGNRNKKLDMQLITSFGKPMVEVKAPCQFEVIGEPLMYGSDSTQIPNCVKTANSQFPKGGMNILFLTPHLPVPLYQIRGSLVRTFFVVPKMPFKIDRKTNRLISSGPIQYHPEGKFLDKRTRGGHDVGFTRISAVLCIEECFNPNLPELSEYEIGHHVLFLRNPNAEVPLPDTLKPDCPELLHDGNTIKWSDNHPMDDRI